jgi:hypothetical protein
MTRDFNNQRREDPKSASRGSSSRRFEEERPSRPTRPRLNRNMVDRAWENGARHNHADYRTRSDSNSHSTQNNKRPDQHTARHSAQAGSTSRKPYGNRQDNYRPGERPPRSNNGSRPRKYDRDQRETYGYERDTRQPGSYGRDKRSSRKLSRPDTRNPRWQNPPKMRRNNYPSRSHEYSHFDAEQELFEGDYEHFTRSNSAQPYTHQTRVDAHTRHRPEKRNVTRLSDGRVLKGTLDEQRRNAEFWTEVAQESDQLVKQVETPHAQEAATKNPANPPTGASAKRKTTKAKVRQNAPKPRSTGPKPSQRGFKWPAPEE